MSTLGQPRLGPGRPRAFVADQALAAALDVFRHKGFVASSLGDLTTAMDLSRSSFYACFGSKHAVFMAAAWSYADRCFAELRAAAEGQLDAEAAIRAMLVVIADPDGDRRGCFFVNSLSELGASDEAFLALARAHVARVGALMTQTVQRLGCTEAVAAERAGLLLALAIGAISLRQAGVPAAHVSSLLAQADLLFPSPA